MRRPLAVLVAALLTLLFPRLVLAGQPGDATLCQQATASAERLTGVPNELLDAISRVESGRYDDAQHGARAWPWTINEEGHGHFYASKNEAVQAAQGFQARGIRSIDVGCTQINLMYHPTAFASLDDAFDPTQNANYAARFLTELFHQVGSWPHAAAAYHSQTPELGTDYQRRVLEAWADPINQPDVPSALGRLASAHPTMPHRQIASISTPFLGSMPILAMPAPVLQSPLARRFAAPIGASFGGLSQVERSPGAARFAFKGRTLAAYRAMPVAMLTSSPPIARY
ncbi:transglycosylase SLT domain-containing protein [Lichenicoccus sp.]|uniref:transglycosylase SLT domain-containing protein n=1 Tax=Lichenicoccus sp. TaxID=2781899 RepID=UPI003D0DCBA2